MTTPEFRLTAAVLGTPDPRGLAEFYRDLFGWRIEQDDPDWVTLRPDGGGTGLSFQLEDGHVPPSWPAGPGEQQMQTHLDIAVEDLADGTHRALALGAALPPYQPQDDVRVLLDPAGHPFCLFQA